MTLNDRLKGLIGLAKRGKYVVYGEKLPFNMKKKKVSLLFLASDAAKNSYSDLMSIVEKLEDTHPIAVIRLLSKEDLGDAIGSAPVAGLGILNSGIAKRIMELEEEINNGQKEQEL
jgi:ribosomal protein L7Ae-like RNA K-turn-binding protein